MELNQYSFYSSLSIANNKSEQELLAILKQVEKFEEINDIDTAKKYLKDTWGIERSVNDYVLNDKCRLNVIESKNAFCINLIHGKENITHYYRK